MISNPFNRERSIYSTLRKCLKVKSKLNISRLSDLTDLDFLGIPVISAVRPVVSDLQISATQGKGYRKVDALVSALMEAVERYSASNYQGEIFVENCTMKDDNFIPINKLGGKPNNQKVKYIESIDLIKNKKIFLPACDVLFPYYSDKTEYRPFIPSTTGLASGNSINEAILHAIFEVVERDTVSKFMETGEAKLLNIDTIKTDIEITLLQKLKSLDVFVLDLSHLSIIPTYFASILNQQGICPAIACAGQASHINPVIALRRALLESAQSRAVAIQGSREDLIRHHSDWVGDFERLKVKRNLLKKNAKASTNIFDTKIEILSNTDQALQFMLNKLNAFGYKEIYYTDLTHQEINIPVVHVSIPGMVDTVIQPDRKRFNFLKV